MTQKELANLIHETLAEMLIEAKHRYNDEYRMNFYREGMITIEEKEEYNIFLKSMTTHHYEIGKMIHTNPVCKHNGAKEDMSMDIEIVDWNSGSGHVCEKIRLYPKQTEKTLVKKIRKFIEENYK